MAKNIAEAISSAEVQENASPEMEKVMSEFETFAKEAGFEGEKAESLKMAIMACMSEAKEDVGDYGMEDMEDE